VSRIPAIETSYKFTRREAMVGAFKTFLATSLLPAVRGHAAAAGGAMRCVNIMNFIRAEEPRETCDLFRPVKEQMALIRKYGFPATWLLQYDALIEGPFVEFLKVEMPADHEVGIWLEMNRKICDDAGIPWRGRPDWEWDYHVPVAYAIGYSPAERRKLVDTAMATFQRVFGRKAETVASWNMDAVSAAHLADRYSIAALGNCRDQLATDGFTIWGAPIAAYYPNRKNAWSPAVEVANQIPVPMFRLLGQDPVYYYDKVFPYPDTMEPVWASGRSEVFVDHFLEMIRREPTLSLAYAQLGQENSFGWPEMQAAYPMQMEKLAQCRKAGGLIVETMGKTGRRFQRSFASTPVQAQVMLADPFGNKEVPRRSAWYQSKFYRANLHFKAEQFYLRDLHVYDDRFPEPYLENVAGQHGIEQRLLAALDGYHWSGKARAGDTGTHAMGRFILIGHNGKESKLAMKGQPVATESGSVLRLNVPLASGGSLKVGFAESAIVFRLQGAPARARLGLVFEWDAERSALRTVSTNRLLYRFRNFDYAVRVLDGEASTTANGARIVADGSAFRLLLRQIS